MISFDMIINNICMALTFGFLDKYFKKLCCVCLKFENICCTDTKLTKNEIIMIKTQKATVKPSNSTNNIITSNKETQTQTHIIP